MHYRQSKESQLYFVTAHNNFIIQEKNTIENVLSESKVCLFKLHWFYKCDFKSILAPIFEIPTGLPLIHSSLSWVVEEKQK